MRAYDHIEIGEALSKRSVLTHSGEVLRLEHPRPESFKIADVAKGLSTLIRFAGQIPRDYTVAQHCVACVRGVLDNWHGDPSDPKLLAALRAALLHEVSEAYIRDVPTPAKLMMPDYVATESRIMLIAGVAFGAQLEPLPAIVKAVDSALCGYEARLFHKDVPADMLDLMFPPADLEIDPEIPAVDWEPRHAREMFLRLWDVLDGRTDAVEHLRNAFRWY